MNIEILAPEIHQANVDAGWWSDLNTGARIERNVGELLMLAVTEIREAREGFAFGHQDDHLPDRSMFEVELADAAIRLLDMVGGLGLTQKVSAYATEFENMTRFKAVETILFDIVDALATAMEHHRKGRTDEMASNLARALVIIEQLSVYCDFDLMEVISEKRAYNANRADHKPENRIKAGGKRV